jgi:alkylation response protein AidB-like acyl-CoA dehydrogenase
MEAGSEEQKKEYLPKLAEGKLLLTMALTEENPCYCARGVTVKATRNNDGYIVQGRKMFVPDANVFDYIICAARTKESNDPEEGITLLLVDPGSPGITVNLLKTMAGDKQCEVIFDNVKVPADNVLGQPEKGWPVLKKVLQKATIARCAEMIGAARAIFEITLEYAKERKTFGHPIGSYQAIQHYCANMVTEADGCELLIHNIAWHLTEGQPMEQEIHIAKAMINESFKRIAALSLQIHGGIGFTEDHDLPLYYKRAKTWEVDLGDSDYHLEKLADKVGF